MHTYKAKEQGLMVTSARLLCKLSLLSLLLLAVIANGIGHSHKLAQEAVSCTKEICQPSLGLKWLRHSVRTHNTGHTQCGFAENIAQHCLCVSLKKWLARDPALLRPGDAPDALRSS